MSGENPQDDRRLGGLRQAFGVIPLNQELGITIERSERGVVWMRLPYDDKLIGNPENGVLHGGAVTALMDTACGACVFTKMDRISPVATLDLRIDYLKPSTPRRDVVARAECYKFTRSIAFVRCIAYHDDETDPIAAAAGAFMITPRKEAPPKDWPPR